MIMNKRQKTVIINFVLVVCITTAMIVAMMDFRNVINRSEAMRAMTHIGKIVLDYRKEHGLAPPESYIDNIKKNLEGAARLGELYYRAQWITIESTEDEILAYVEKNSKSLFVDDGAIVLRLDGRIEWITKEELSSILSKQQSAMELEMLQK